MTSGQELVGFCSTQAGMDPVKQPKWIGLLFPSKEIIHFFSPRAGKKKKLRKGGEGRGLEKKLK